MSLEKRIVDLVFVKAHFSLKKVFAAIIGQLRASICKAIIDLN